MTHTIFLRNKSSLADYSFLLNGLFKVKNKLGRERFIVAIFNYHSHFQRQGSGSQTRTLLSCHLSPIRSAQYSSALVSNDANGVMMNLMSNGANDVISPLKTLYHLLLVL